ncbi:MAG: hypothetical protein IID40_01850 [Planctomycetes bacterium]|nr:hypothetical protein [Planctomycetota bacterium]
MKSKPAYLMLAAVAAVACSGCTELADEFRRAAGPSLQTGLTAALTGVVDGAFAVFTPDTEDASGGTP